jgi:DNA-binding PadR family transcriptional regulator
VGKYAAGKGVNYQKYVMLTLKTMYEAGVVHFTASEACSWAGIPRNGSFIKILDQLVSRGWLGVEPAELREGRSAKTYTMQSAIWFGAK